MWRGRGSNTTSRGGRDINDLFSFRTAPEAWPYEGKCPGVAFHNCFTCVHNLTDYWVCCPCQIALRTISSPLSLILLRSNSRGGPKLLNFHTKHLLTPPDVFPKLIPIALTYSRGWTNVTWLVLWTNRIDWITALTLAFQN